MADTVESINEKLDRIKARHRDDPVYQAFERAAQDDKEAKAAEVEGEETRAAEFRKQAEVMLVQAKHRFRMLRGRGDARKFLQTVAEGKEDEEG